MRASVYLTVAGGLLFFLPLGIGAEDLLVRETGKFLGWRIANEKFRYCDKTITDIGLGRIEKTQDSCRTAPIPRASFEWKGKLELADAETGTVRILGNDGKPLDLYLPPDSKSWLLLRSMPTGEPVRAFGPVPGRAEVVEKIQM